MLGFFSKEKDSSQKVKKDEIFFVSCPDDTSKEQIKVLFSKQAISFAEKFNISEVFLHFGKEMIFYDFKV